MLLSDVVELITGRKPVPYIGICYRCKTGVPYFSGWALRDYAERESRLMCSKHAPLANKSAVKGMISA